MIYTISLYGCDDSTYFVMDLEEPGLALVEEMCRLSKETSTYGCMPTMDIKEGDTRIK